MCGIVGYVYTNGEQVEHNKHLIKKMTDVIAHRGPDGEGSYFGKNFAFGHRRLAIVDLSKAGHQPMEYQHRYIITYNGEIYNFPELKKELKKQGYVFKSETDTEVIMASYDFWGVKCLEKFNGMWAFVLYDNSTETFFISRDRFGIKPLYFYNKDGEFVFGSEIKSILEHSEEIGSPNIDYLRKFVKDGTNEYNEETAFLDISRFPSASYFLGSSVDLEVLSVQKFWKVKNNLSGERFCHEKANQYAQQYYDLLYDAVKLRLRADVKVGSALSGGLDSSSIVYLVNQQLRAMGKEELQETFSSVYKEEGTTHCDESQYINLMSKELGVNSNQIEARECDIPSELESMIRFMENPPENTCMSMWHTFKKVAESNVVVTLDGQGADEQLAGYITYLPSYLTSLSIIDFYKVLPCFFKIPGAKKYLFRAFVLNNFKWAFGKGCLSFVLDNILKKKINLSLNTALEESFNNGLVNLLHYADRGSMGNSIESRMPFMDYRLVEFLASIPACYKIHNGWTKYIARLAFDKKLPDDICWRIDKMGWPIPEDKWFNGGLKSWLKSELINSDLVKEVVGDLKGVDELPRKNKVRLLNLAIFDKVFS